MLSPWGRGIFYLNETTNIILESLQHRNLVMYLLLCLLDFMFNEFHYLVFLRVSNGFMNIKATTDRASKESTKNKSNKLA